MLAISAARFVASKEEGPAGQTGGARRRPRRAHGHTPAHTPTFLDNSMPDPDEHLTVRGCNGASRLLPADGSHLYFLLVRMHVRVHAHWHWCWSVTSTGVSAAHTGHATRKGEHMNEFSEEQYAAFVRLADVVGADQMVEAFAEGAPHTVAMAARYEDEHQD